MTLPLQSLLRQGKEVSDTLLEMPVFPNMSGQESQQQQQQQGEEVDSRQPLLPVGYLVVRAINVGKEPANSCMRIADFDAAGQCSQPGAASKKVSERTLACL
jgi:hypothetical protein